MKKSSKKSHPIVRLFKFGFIVGAIGAVIYLVAPHVASFSKVTEVSNVEDGEPSILQPVESAESKEKRQAIEDIIERPEFQEQVKLKAEETYLEEKKSDLLSQIDGIEVELETVRHEMVSFE